LILHRWYVAIIILIAVLWAIVEALEWRVRRKASEWCANDLAKRGIYVDTPPAKDSRGSQGQFEAIRKMSPGRDR